MSERMFYMCTSANQFGRTTKMIREAVAALKPNAEIKVTCPDVEKLESELTALKAEIAEKDSVLEKYKNIAWQTGGNMTREESMAAATVLAKHDKHKGE